MQCSGRVVRRLFSTDAQTSRLWRWGGSGGPFARTKCPEASAIPVEMILPAKGTIDAVELGVGHSAVVVDGDLYTWGSDEYKKLGREGPTDQPGKVAENVKAVSLGSYHSAFVDKNGDVYTWGWGGNFWHGAGALGHGSTDSVATPKKVQKFADLELKVKQVACGSQHMVVLTEDGTVYSTGNGEFGKLGLGETTDELEFEHVDILNDDGESVTIKKIGCGSNFSAALTEEGEFYMWGRNDHGQLGLGDESMGDMYSAEKYPRRLPLQVADFALGENHVVALGKDGNVYSWGSRTWLAPHVVIPAGTTENIVKLACGSKFWLALTSSGEVYAWGKAKSGGLGRDTKENAILPQPIPREAFENEEVIDIVCGPSRVLAISKRS